MVAWDKMDESAYGYEWALEMNETFKKNILSGNHQSLIDYGRFGAAALMAIPTPDHYYPLLYALALQSKLDETEIFNDKAVAGSLTMTSVRIG
jgi:4,5-DOPA dioxygenase extradiol